MAFHKTFDAYIPSNVEELFSLVQFQPKYVPFSVLRDDHTPTEAACTSSYEYAEKIVKPATFVHSVRCYYFCIAMLHNGFPSNTPGVPQIEFAELKQRLYHACLLHDLGLTENPEALAHPAHAMSFELHGGIMAYDHLHTADPALDAVQVGDIVQSIMLHTIPFQRGKSSAVEMLLQLSTCFDVLGFDALGPGSFGSLFSRETIREIETAYPRGNFNLEAQVGIPKMLSEKPNCLVNHGPTDLLLRGAKIKSLVPEDE